eukprot:IDg11495t1
MPLAPAAVLARTSLTLCYFAGGRETLAVLTNTARIYTRYDSLRDLHIGSALRQESGGLHGTANIKKTVSFTNNLKTCTYKSHYSQHTQRSADGWIRRAMQCQAKRKEQPHQKSARYRFSAGGAASFPFSSTARMMQRTASFVAVSIASCFTRLTCASLLLR